MRSDAKERHEEPVFPQASRYWVARAAESADSVTDAVADSALVHSRPTFASHVHAMDRMPTVSDALGAHSGSFAGAIHPAGYRQETRRSGQGHQERPDGGRQRLDADQRGAGADDDRSGAGAVLRRPGAQEERAEHHDAQLRSDGHGFHSVGGGRLQPGVRRRERVFRRSALSVPERCGRALRIRITPRPFRTRRT